MKYTGYARSNWIHMRPMEMSEVTFAGTVTSIQKWRDSYSPQRMKWIVAARRLIMNRSREIDDWHQRRPM